jgi:hypothetical protein
MRRGKNAPTNGGSGRINTPEDTASTRSALKSPTPSPPAVNIPCGQNDRSDAPLLQLSGLDLYCGVTESNAEALSVSRCILGRTQNTWLAGDGGQRQGELSPATPQGQMPATAGHASRGTRRKGCTPPWRVHEKVADRDYRHRFQGSYSGFIRTHNERQPCQYHAPGHWGLVPGGGT